MSEEESRAAFEKVVRETNCNGWEVPLHRTMVRGQATEGYRHGMTELAWRIWKAGRASALEGAELVACLHLRLNEDGVCCVCGEDCRGFPLTGDKKEE